MSVTWTRRADWFRSDIGTVRRGKLLDGDWWWRPKGGRCIIGPFQSAFAAMRYAEDDVAAIRAKRDDGGAK